MKVYATEVVLCGIVRGVDRKTFRKWSWVFIEALSYLESDVVSTNYKQQFIFFIKIYTPLNALFSNKLPFNFRYCGVIDTEMIFEMIV